MVVLLLWWLCCSWWWLNIVGWLRCVLDRICWIDVGLVWYWCCFVLVCDWFERFWLVVCGLIVWYRLLNVWCGFVCVLWCDRCYRRDEMLYGVVMFCWNVGFWYSCLVGFWWFWYCIECCYRLIVLVLWCVVWWFWYWCWLVVGWCGFWFWLFWFWIWNRGLGWWCCNDCVWVLERLGLCWLWWLNVGLICGSCGWLWLYCWVWWCGVRLFCCWLRCCLLWRSSDWCWRFVLYCVLRFWWCCCGLRVGLVFWLYCRYWCVVCFCYRIGDIFGWWVILGRLFCWNGWGSVMNRICFWCNLEVFWRRVVGCFLDRFWFYGWCGGWWILVCFWRCGWSCVICVGCYWVDGVRFWFCYRYRLVYWCFFSVFFWWSCVGCWWWDLDLGWGWIFCCWWIEWRCWCVIVVGWIVIDCYSWWCLVFWNFWFWWCLLRCGYLDLRNFWSGNFCWWW